MMKWRVLVPKLSQKLGSLRGEEQVHKKFSLCAASAFPVINEGHSYTSHTPGPERFRQEYVARKHFLQLFIPEGHDFHDRTAHPVVIVHFRSLQSPRRSPTPTRTAARSLWPWTGSYGRLRRPSSTTHYWTKLRSSRPPLSPPPLRMWPNVRAPQFPLRGLI